MAKRRNVRSYYFLFNGVLIINQIHTLLPEMRHSTPIDSWWSLVRVCVVKHGNHNFDYYVTRWEDHWNVWKAIEYNNIWGFRVSTACAMDFTEKDLTCGMLQWRNLGT